ncbi:hypothetical protein CVT26_014018 [Gymnopilus dilepis]|uniref:Uncharacterized protein n=1 Tax=Gymnopilus dilepis TaxID=231916 RepID=A0A409VU40_9AGAR|nr:hypothetical protein CVT26_014018 [Gymnopilus dilepis]
MQLPTLEIYSVRSVLGACFALAARLPVRYYNPVPVVPLVFLYHVLISPLYLASSFKLGDILLLPLNILGVVYLIKGLIIDEEYICILICFVLCFFLAGEFLLRILSLLGIWFSYSYSFIFDVRPKDNSTFYQRIIGDSFSMARFRGEEPTTDALAEYGIPAKKIRSIFRARIGLLRVVLALCCSFLALVPAVWNFLEDESYQYCIQLVPFIILHHLLSSVHMEFNYVLFDIPFLTYEITSIGAASPTLGSFGGDWSSPLLNCYTIVACLIFVALLLEAGIWIRILIWHKTSRQPSYNHVNPESLDPRMIPRPHSIVFGPWLWKAHLSGETRIIRGIRGLVAIAITVIILSYSVLDLIFYPFQNTGLNYFKDLRSSRTPDSLSVNNLAWNVVVINPAFPVNPSDYALFQSQWGTRFMAAVNVTPLWSTEAEFGYPACAYTSNTTNYMTDNTAISRTLHWQPGYRPIDTVFCPRIPIGGPPEIASIPSPYITPDLLITVNFTALNISAEGLDETAKKSVQIMIGFHNDTSRIVQTTQAMTLVPGINMLGCVTYELRQTFKNSFAPDLGLSNSYDTFAVSKMVYTIPDPLASTSSSSVKQSPDISTFRVFLQNDMSDLRTLQSYKEQDTLSGFAAVGGLWTFLSGIFAAIFGSSLLRILFGVKPISLTGVAHSIEREKIQEACRREYPKITEEIRLPREERGLLSLLCDELIDVQLFEREPTDSADFVSNRGHGRGDVEMDQLELLKP